MEKVKAVTAEQKAKEKADTAKSNMLYSLIPKSHQTTLETVLEGKKKWTQDSSEHKNNTNRLIKWMIDAIQPYAVIQN